MRVIAGEAKGRRLKTTRVQDIRPTSDKVKEALFSILTGRIQGARMLELFAGTGAIGIEALSRGAAQVDFVESDPAAVKVLEENVAACGFSHRAGIHPMDSFRFMKQARTSYDLLFADPPYHRGLLKKLLPAIGQGDIMKPNSLVIVEHFRKITVPNKISHLVTVRAYHYGDTVLTLFRREAGLE